MSSKTLLTPETRLEFEHWRRKFVADLFHALGQPMTALHCSLELALRHKQSKREYLEALERALEMSGRLLEIAKWERDLTESTDPGRPVLMDLSAEVRDVAEELGPVFNSAGSELHLVVDEPAPILADPTRIRRALFILLNQASRALLPGRNLLLLVSARQSVVAIYLGATFSHISNAGRTGIRVYPSAKSVQLIANIAKAAQGTLEMLVVPSGCKYLLEFPLYHEESQRVSTEPKTNFSL